MLTVAALHPGSGACGGHQFDHQRRGVLSRHRVRQQRVLHGEGGQSVRRHRAGAAGEHFLARIERVDVHAKRSRDTGRIGSAIVSDGNRGIALIEVRRIGHLKRIAAGVGGCWRRRSEAGRHSRVHGDVEAGTARSPDPAREVPPCVCCFAQADRGARGVEPGRSGGSRSRRLHEHRERVSVAGVAGAAGWVIW